MKFNFQFGPKKFSIFRASIVAVILAISVSILHKCSNVKEDYIWDLIDEFQRVFQGRGFTEDINNHIINNPRLLERRIKRDVDKVILNYEIQTSNRYVPPNMKNEEILREIQKDKYTEEQRTIIKDAIYYQCNPDDSEAQALLGGVQGIHAVWYNSKECKY